MQVKKLKRHVRLIVGGPILFALILAACFSGWLAPADPYKIDTKNILKGPSGQHPFGTDQIGRDILSRVIFGARVSLSVSGAAVFFAIGKRRFSSSAADRHPH